MSAEESQQVQAETAAPVPVPAPAVEQDHSNEATTTIEEKSSGAATTAPATEEAPASEKAASQDNNGDGETKQEEGDEEDDSAAPVLATQGGREKSDKILYVGNLPKSINDDLLKQYFQIGGSISSVKIIPDKNSQECNYAFVEYFEPHDANVAYQTLNGKEVEGKVLKINWAFQSQQVNSDETFNLFVGDLNVDVDDATLAGTFKEFPSFIQAHVMWDMQSGRSRGYGFVSFGEQDQAQVAMETKQGFELNGRALRINWASKREPQQSQQGQRRFNGPAGGRGGFRNNNNQNQNHHNHNGINRHAGPPPHHQMQSHLPPQLQQQPPIGIPPIHQAPLVPPPVDPEAVEDMMRRAPPRVTTAYIGNIPHFAQEHDLIPLLQNFGFIIDFKHYPEKGCCFIKYDTHEQAALCIVALTNFPFQGRNLRTGWGKEKPTFIRPQQQMGPIPVQIPVEEQQQQFENAPQQHDQQQPQQQEQ
ncbi:Pub1 [Kluyveromyces lactis]|nr:Pub1 [Kluyveromyces lactis]